MYAVFTNPSGWPDRMKVRDLCELEARITKLARRGYRIKILSIHHGVRSTWDAMLVAQRDFKRSRYGYKST